MSRIIEFRKSAQKAEKQSVQGKTCAFTGHRPVSYTHLDVYKRQLKEWAKSIDVCPENASRFLVDKPNPGLTALFVDAFRQQTEAQKDVTSEKATERDPEVVAWESDEITSIEVKTVEVKSPFAPLPEEAAQAPKAHRLTAEEKAIKAAVMDTLKGQIAYNNDGMRASYRASNHSFNLLARNGVRIEGNTVTQNGEPLFKIHRRHAARKTQGCYRELLPTLELSLIHISMLPPLNPKRNPTSA